MDKENEQKNEMFEITKLIGEGGQGKVYKGIYLNNNVDNFVAIKTIHIYKFEDDFLGLESSHTNQSFIQKFNEEINILSNLTHENIVQYIDSIILNNIPYMILEYCDDDLKKMIKNRKNDISIKKFCLNVLSGLNYLHSNDIIHRDLKPENILVKNDIFKIGDFGLSKIVENSCVSNAGTLDYIAPEYLSNRLTLKSDIWSFGKILLEILLNEHLKKYDIINELDLCLQDIKCYDIYKTIVKNCLVVNQKKRSTTTDLLCILTKKTPESIEKSSQVNINIENIEEEIIKNSNININIENIEEELIQNIDINKKINVIKRSYLNPYVLKIVFLGDSKSGKTSLLNNYLKNEITKEKHPCTDLLVKKIIIDDEHINLHIWDTPGFGRFQGLGTTFYRGTDASIFIFDVAIKETFDVLEQWRKDFLISINNEGNNFPMLVIANNVNKNNRIVTTKMAKDFCDKYEIEYVEYDGDSIINVEKGIKSIVIKAISNINHNIDNIDFDFTINDLNLNNSKNKESSKCF